MAGRCSLSSQERWEFEFFCTYVRLNARTKTDKYPFPPIDEILEDLACHEWYSLFDVFSGYYTVQSTEDRAL